MVSSYVDKITLNRKKTLFRDGDMFFFSALIHLFLILMIMLISAEPAKKSIVKLQSSSYEIRIVETLVLSSGELGGGGQQVDTESIKSVEVKPESVAERPELKKNSNLEDFMLGVELSRKYAKVSPSLRVPPVFPVTKPRFDGGKGYGGGEGGGSGKGMGNGVGSGNGVAVAKRNRDGCGFKSGEGAVIIEDVMRNGVAMKKITSYYSQTWVESTDLEIGYGSNCPRPWLKGMNPP